MSHQYDSTLNPASRQATFPSAARALLMGLALAVICPAAMAGDPIPGLDVKLGKNPGGIIAHTPTDANGNFVLRVTEAGNYTASIICGNCQISINASGMPLTGINGAYNFAVAKGVAVVLSGQVQSGAGNKAAINTTRSNIKHPSIVVEPPPPPPQGVGIKPNY